MNMIAATVTGNVAEHQLHGHHGYRWQATPEGFALLEPAPERRGKLALRPPIEDLDSRFVGDPDRRARAFADVTDGALQRTPEELDQFMRECNGQLDKNSEASGIVHALGVGDNRSVVTIATELLNLAMGGAKAIAFVAINADGTVDVGASENKERFKMVGAVAQLQFTMMATKEAQHDG
jgi:hypothetical protein